VLLREREGINNSLRLRASSNGREKEEGELTNKRLSVRKKERKREKTFWDLTCAEGSQATSAGFWTKEKKERLSPFFWWGEKRRGQSVFSYSSWKRIMSKKEG